MCAGKISKNKLHVQFAPLSTIHVVSSSWCSKIIFHVKEDNWDVCTLGTCVVAVFVEYFV